MISSRNIFQALTFTIALCAGTAYSTQWPEIRETKETIPVVNADSSKAGMELTVKSLDGKDLYKISCHSGNYASNGQDYSGLLQCYVTSLLFKGKSEQPFDRDLQSNLRLG